MDRSDDTFPRDFTEQAPGQKNGWLLKKIKSIGKNRYCPVWVELDEINQTISCFSQPSHLGSLKSEKLLSFELDKAQISSAVSKKGKLLIVIVDNKRRKRTFATNTVEEHKEWVDALSRTHMSSITKRGVVNKWAVDSCTLQKIEISGDAFLSLAEDPPSRPSTEFSSASLASSCSDETEDDEFSVDNEKDLKRALYSMFLLDVDGNLTLFGDLVNGKTTLLFFLRHFGCILWRAAIEEVIAKRDVLEKCGIRVAAIGNGTPEMAREFLNDYPKFPGRLFVDPDKKVYNAMHCKFGVKYAFSENVLQGVREACEKGHKQKGIQGDPLQLGGTFIISPIKGMIYRRLENYIGSATDLPTLIPFIEEYSKNNPEITWLTHSIDDPLATSKFNREFQFNYYQNYFILQLHSLYILPRSEQNLPLIFIVMDLKQGDKKCLAFHAKGKTKFYWPCYLSEQEMFDHATRRILGKPIDRFVKVIRNAALVDLLCSLEDTINNFFVTEAPGDLEEYVTNTAEAMLQHIEAGYQAKPVAMELVPRTEFNLLL